MKPAAALAAALIAFLAGVAQAQDPNAKGPDGYTPLARVLFDRREPAAKMEQLRVLLERGADLNADHGGRGRLGALALALRHEPEVVALLVARGATLSDPGGHGPLTIAIESERDDLALALLRREPKVSPQDRVAIPFAAKRGWTAVVEALVAAGADLDAADTHGNSGLAHAQRRRDERMAKALLAAGARPVSAVVRPRLPAGSDFAMVAAREIDQVFFLDPPRFTLSLEGDVGFAFYGEETNRFSEVKCERSAAFGLIAMANMAGGLRVGICTREARRVRELARAAPKGLENLLGILSQSGAKLDRGALEKAGWTHGSAKTPGGSEEHYFALLAVGHGVLSAPTLVLLPRGGRRAIVVQAESGKLCENYGIESQIPFCSNPRQALGDVARRVAASVPD